MEDNSVKELPFEIFKFKPENGKMINVPCELFAGCREGDVVNITPDAQETQKRTEEIRSELKKLFDN